MDFLRSCTEQSICSFKKNCISVTLCYSIGNSYRHNWVNSFLLASLSHYVGVNKPMLLSVWKTRPWHKYPFQMQCMFHVINKFSLGGSYALLLLIHCVLTCLQMMSQAYQSSSFYICRVTFQKCTYFDHNLVPCNSLIWYCFSPVIAIPMCIITFTSYDNG